MRIALIGAGAMGTIVGREVYPALRDSVEIATVIDRDPGRRARLAELLGAQHHATLREALAAGPLDAVDIRLPHAAHADAAIAALEQRLHVLVEKPLALSLSDCDRIAATAARIDRVVAVAENYPHLRAVRAAREAIEAGRVGELLAVRSTRAYTLDGVWARSAWRQGADPMAGVLWDQGTHHTSMLRVLAGEIVAVSARSGPSGSPGAEVQLLTVRFESGLVGQSLYCWGTPARLAEVEGTVLGSRGAIDIRVAYDRSDGGADLVCGEDVEAISDAENYYDSHVAIVRDWVDACETGRPPRVGVASATADVAVVLAARASLSRGGAEVSTRDL